MMDWLYDFDGKVKHVEPLYSGFRKYSDPFPFCTLNFVDLIAWKKSAQEGCSLT